MAAAIAKRGRRPSRSERLRSTARVLAANRHQDFGVIDEAFAGFTRVDVPVANDDDQTSENNGKFPTRLTDCSPPG
jgi:hypothetical protein